MLSELNPGDTAYFFFFHTWFIVPVTILEVEIHFAVNNKSYMYSKNQEDEYICYSSKEFETEENPWGFKYVTDKQEIAELINSCTSQGETFYWLDEPVGHSLTLDGDGLFKSLQEAMNASVTINKRCRKRKYKKVTNLRRKIFKSLSKQNIEAGSGPITDLEEKLKKLNSKKVYCRKK